MSESNELHTLLWLADASGKSPMELLAMARGETLVTFREPGGGTISVKVNRVYFVESWGRGEQTRMHFTMAKNAHPMSDQRPVVIDKERRKVERDLRAEGWPGNYALPPFVEDSQ